LLVNVAHRFSPAEDPNDPARGHQGSLASRAGEAEELPYKVELWNDAKHAVEQVLAVTASASIGYAAYFAATREFPDRFVTLRHKNSVVSKWNGPTH
jgi:hypothetical protein